MSELGAQWHGEWSGLEQRTLQLRTDVSEGRSISQFPVLKP